jgi:hypothetical protein
LNLHQAILQIITALISKFPFLCAILFIFPEFGHLFLCRLAATNPPNAL